MKPTLSHLPRLWSGVMACLLTATTLAACTNPLSSSSESDIHKIKHIIVIMQENRSFDTYFGTYPGANGIPMKNGIPTVCVNDPQTGQCIKPYHDTQNLNHGGPHGAANATADINGGKMDGFIAQAERGKGSCINPNEPACSGNGRTDVMGYHTAHEIPNYWSHQQNRQPFFFRFASPVAMQNENDHPPQSFSHQAKRHTKRHLSCSLFHWASTLD